MIPSAYISTPYVETAFPPPYLTNIMFITIDVPLPATLLRKFGIPEARIFLTVVLSSLGLVNFNVLFPMANGTIAMIIDSLS